MSAPISRSPGYLVFHYQNSGVLHTTGVALLAGIDPGDPIIMQAAADELATAMALCLPNTATLLDWYTTDRARHSVIAGAFTEAHVGSRDNSAQQWLSTTLTLTGLEGGSDGSYRAGKTRIVLFVGNSYSYVAGEKVFSTSTVPALVALAELLRTSVIYWAGFYGVKASVHGNAPVQFNAAIQKRHGN